jgi:hypothetical protein
MRNKRRMTLSGVAIAVSMLGLTPDPAAARGGFGGGGFHGGFGGGFRGAGSAAQWQSVAFAASVWSDNLAGAVDGARAGGWAGWRPSWRGGWGGWGWGWPVAVGVAAGVAAATWDDGYYPYGGYSQCLF